MPTLQERLAGALASESLVKRSVGIVVKLHLEGLVAVISTGILFALPFFAVYEVGAWGLTPTAVGGAWATCATLAFSQIYCFSTSEPSIGT